MPLAVPFDNLACASHCSLCNPSSSCVHLHVQEAAEADNTQPTGHAGGKSKGNGESMAGGQRKTESVLVRMLGTLVQPAALTVYIACLAVYACRALLAGLCTEQHRQQRQLRIACLTGTT